MRFLSDSNSELGFACKKSVASAEKWKRRQQQQNCHTAALFLLRSAAQSVKVREALDEEKSSAD